MNMPSVYFWILPLWTRVMLRRLFSIAYRIAARVSRSEPPLDTGLMAMDEGGGAVVREGLDADGRGVGEADLGDLHLLDEEIDDLLGLGGALLPLDAGVDVLRVLPEDDHVDLLGVLHRRRHALEIANGSETDVQVQHLAQRHVQGAEALADGRRERALDRDQVFADHVHGLVRQQVGRTVRAIDGLRLVARVDFRPRDLALAAVGLLDGGVQHAHRGGPDVRSRAVALDERDVRAVRDLQLAVPDRDLPACRELYPRCHDLVSLPKFMSGHSGRNPP